MKCLMNPSPKFSSKKCDIDCFFDVTAESPPVPEPSPQAHEEEEKRPEEKEEASKDEGMFMIAFVFFCVTYSMSINTIVHILMFRRWKPCVQSW